MGHWQAQYRCLMYPGDRPNHYWVCTGCGARHRGTPENDDAALSALGAGIDLTLAMLEVEDDGYDEQLGC